jgi:cellulose synthase/poly-beta-1,6-N-acetylglucosamine synthase-like glycosyltransferase
MTFLFWAACILLLHAFFGYPLVLRIFTWRGHTAPPGVDPASVKKGSRSQSRKKERNLQNSSPRKEIWRDMKLDDPFSVSIVITVRNEASFIEKKLNNTFDLDYPPELREVIVAVNGSRDGTKELVKKHLRRGVKLIMIPEAGKSIAQNRAVAHAEGDIVVFSDANSFYRSHTLRELVRPFGDPSVGLVQGKLVYRRAGRNPATWGEGAYWRYENWVKRGENRWGTCIAANGGIMAIRKELFGELSPEEMEDFALPVRVALMGYRSIYHPDAVAEESLEGAPRWISRRKERIVNQDSRTFFSLLPEIISPLRSKILFLLISHKLLRWVAVPLLCAILLSSLVLANDHMHYRWFLLFQCIFYIAALGGHVYLSSFSRDSAVATGIQWIPYYFLLANIAAFRGLCTMLFGTRTVAWQDRERRMTG